MSIADRAFFKTFKSGNAASPILIQLVPGRLGEGWATVVAYEVVGPNGEFIGVLTRAIAPAAFERFFASVALGQDAAIALHHRDGTLLARFPHAQAMIGRKSQDRPRQSAEIVYRGS